MTKRIAFIDDNPEMLESCHSILDNAAIPHIQCLSSNVQEIEEWVRELEKCHSDARMGRQTSPISSPLDSADVVFVDYDLLEFKSTRSMTGEEVAYMLRLYSKCGAIVLMNPGDRGINFFDLRLRNTIESFADIHIGSLQIGNPWLWGDTKSAFSPWCWPNLLDLVSRQNEFRASLENRADEPVVEILGLRGLVETFDREMHDVINGETTCRNLIVKSRWGVARKDASNLPDALLTRVAAARIMQWINNVLSPAATVVIDLPQLVQRVPGVLKESLSSGDLDRIASREAEVVKTLLKEEVWLHRLSVVSFWASRPLFDLNALREDPRYYEWTEHPLTSGLVFCEDTSKFVPAKEASPFIANTPSQSERRFVSKDRNADIVYTPASRLLR